MTRYLIAITFFISLGCNQTQQPATSNLAATKNNNNMRTLGLIGGTSWHSTIDYYQIINQEVNNHFNNNTNPPLIVYTINQAEIHRLQKEDKWDSIAEILTNAAINLRNAGAEAVMFCANTPHKVFGSVQQKLNFPVIHIADATAKVIKNKGISKVGFIGTKYTMQEDFITQRLANNGIEVLLPNDTTEVNELHRIIHTELTYGKATEESKRYVIKVLQTMIDKGAKGIVLGCTEFPLMISENDLTVPVFNTTAIHAKAGVAFILNQ